MGRTDLPSGQPETVYVFGTCLIDLFDPESGMAAMELLRLAGITPIFPQGQSCCAQPAFNSGHAEDARDVARAQLALFPKDIPIVVPSGSCAGMIKHHWPEMFAGRPEEAAARRIAERVVELSDFLLGLRDLALVDKGPPVTVTWHGSCHARREMGITDQPKQLLARLSNVTLVAMARESECCGFGGTFAVRFDDVSGAMVADKCAAAEDTGADILLSGDLGCLMNITGALEKAGRPLKTRHFARFLLDRIKP